MNNGKALLLTMLAIVIIMSCSAKADTLDDVLKDKRLVKQGRCGITAKGELSADESKSIGLMPCEFSIKEGDEENIYFMLYQNGKPHRYIKVNIKTKVQEVIWRDPNSMV